MVLMVRVVVAMAVVKTVVAAAMVVVMSGNYGKYDGVNGEPYSC